MKITESDSYYDNLEKMSVHELLSSINKEDKTVPFVIEKNLPSIEQTVDAIVKKMKKGGRLFYIGSGTSGRLGVVDASECPPTFGVNENLVIGIIAGGEIAIRKAVENAEDEFETSWEDLQKHNITKNDFVIGLSASGTTPYVVGAIQNCSLHKIETACITCNENSPLAHESKFKIELVVGPEFVTGSTRMKAGTAQKLVLNMISTSVMIKLGKVKGNKMVELQLNNKKLVERAIRIISGELNISIEEAEKLLQEKGSIRNALNS